MSFRSLGSKVFNNVKILVNTQQIINSDNKNNAENNEYKQNVENINNNNNNNNPPLKRISSSRRKKRQRMHFRPIIPQHYICPITQELMTDPVIISSGHTFERTAIIEWFESGNTLNPLTGQPLQTIDIKPNYALKDAIKEYRRKLADELFRITFDSDKNEEILHYRDNILFSTDTHDSDNEDEKSINHMANMNNEYDGYITDDENEQDDIDVDSSFIKTSSADDSNSNLNNINKKHKRKKKHKYKREYNHNIPIIAFLGPNNTGKSTLLNLIVGEPVFVTMDELSDYDTLSKVVRFKIVTRADREFILLDVEGLFPHQCDKNNVDIDNSVLKIFFAVYSIASVIVWNDTNENNPYLQKLLHKADIMMEDINRDGDYYFRPYDIKDMNDFAQTPSGGLLPEELRLFLLKKYKKLTKKRENMSRGGINIGTTYSHKPAFIILKRDYIRQMLNDTPNTSPWLLSDNNNNNSPSLFSLSSQQHLPPFITEMHTDSPSGDFSPSPRIHKHISKYNKINYQILNKSSTSYNTGGGSSGNDSAVTISNNNESNNQSLSIVDELKEENEKNNELKEEKKYNQFSDSSVLMDNVLNHSIIYGGDNIHKNENKKSNVSSILFSDYLKKHDDFYWLRQLNLFSYVDGIVLHKLDNNDINDEYISQDDSLLSILPKLDNWINEWCKYSKNIIPIVNNNKDMLLIIKIINKYNVISSCKYVEECMKYNRSRLHKYFYYDANEKTLNELKLIAERFKWDNKNLIRWFIKHFNRIWYYIKDFPNAHYAITYQSLFYQYHLNENHKLIIPNIILHISHFYYQISNKIDLYRNIVDKSGKWGEFCGAVSGLGSLSLISVLHPLVGIAAVPFSIHLASTLGNPIGVKVGDAIAYSKAHFLDQTERYDLGEINPENNDENKDEIVYHPCYHSDNNDDNNNHNNEQKRD